MGHHRRIVLSCGFGRKIKRQLAFGCTQSVLEGAHLGQTVLLDHSGQPAVGIGLRLYREDPARWSNAGGGKRAVVSDIRTSIDERHSGLQPVANQLGFPWLGWAEMV